MNTDATISADEAKSDRAMRWERGGDGKAVMVHGVSFSIVAW
jgi:hypothetical protein